MSQLSQPPSRPVRLRRSPRTRRAAVQDAKNNLIDTSTEMSRVRSFTASALAIGAGGDLAAVAPVGQRMRVLWKEDAARIIAIFVVLVAVVVVGMTLMQSPQDGYAHSASQSQVAAENQQVATEDQQATAEDQQVASKESTGKGSLAESSAKSTLTVYVSGEVAHPGVLELPDQSRVNDAVQAAGGLTPNADVVRINLAAPITDGEHIHVLGRNEEASAAGSSPTGSSATGASANAPGDTSAQININTANEQQLQAIPGVGPATAAAIVHWRQTHGKFSSVDELVEVNGIGSKTIERLRPYVRV